LHVRPNDEVRDAYGERIEQLAERQRAFAHLRDAPAQTRMAVRSR
jgi:signal transduction protein with GAF and PtsI domain